MFLGKPVEYWHEVKAQIEAQGLDGCYFALAALRKENERLREMLIETVVEHEGLRKEKVEELIAFDLAALEEGTQDE